MLSNIRIGLLGLFCLFLSENVGLKFVLMKKCHGTNLKPSVQIAGAAVSTNSMLGSIRSAFTCLNERILPPLYKALVRPHMEFAIQAWSPYLKKDIQKLEKVQRRATKLVGALPDPLAYEDRLKFLGLTILEQRRTQGDMLHTFKILKGYDKEEAGSAFLELDANHSVGRSRGCGTWPPLQLADQESWFRMLQETYLPPKVS